jgi:hypothetical protein
MLQGQLGKDWLDFSKQQFATGQDRQVAEDALVKKVIDSQMASQDKANLWADQDRATQEQYRTKYDAWADEDRAAGKAAQADYAGYAKDALATGDKYSAQLDGIAGSFGKGADEQNAFAAAQRDRYTSTFQPIEDKLASDAMGWDSAERQGSEAAKAKASVLSEAALADQASQRQMASMGVNPNSGRFSGGARASSLNTALASAGAQNIARDNVQQQGISLRGQAVGVGQNVVGNANTATSLGIQQKGMQQGATQAAYGTKAAGQSQAMQATTGGLAAAGVGNTAAQLGLGQQGAGYTGLGVGVNAGSAAVGSNGAANSNFYANNGVMSQGFSGGMQGAAGQAGSLNTQYANQLNGWGMQQQANASSSAGFGAMLGQIAGAGITVF